MQRYDPQRLERATRDVVSRSSYLEIAAGRGTPSGGVYIDARHLGEDFLLTSFPGMVERCADYGFDLLHDRVEVSPSAHFQMGGITIDVDCRTSLEGLFAAGEDAGGVHGANRLGGNGVADSIVFGGCAGDSMIQFEETIEPGGEFTPGAHGGGGTAFEPIFERVKELQDAGEMIAGVIYLTDMDGSFPSAEEVEVATLWLSTNPGRHAPFGRVVDIPPLYDY